MIVSEIFSRFGFKVDKASMEKVTRAQTAIAKKSQGLGKKIQNSVAKDLGGFAVGAVGVFAVVRSLGALATAAGNAEEAANLADVAFESGSAGFKSFADDLAGRTAAGRGELIKFGADLQILNKKLLGSTQEAQTATQKLIERAVDTASLKDAEVGEVLTAIRSGISGESEPLKRFGTIMSQGALNAFALSKGINKTVQSMTEQEKAALRVQFIINDLSDAEGDAEKTAGSLANRMKDTRAAFQDMLQSVGRVLRPVFIGLAAGVNLAITAIGTLADGVGKVMDVMGRFHRENKILSTFLGVTLVGAAGMAAKATVAAYGKMAVAALASGAKMIAISLKAWAVIIGPIGLIAIAVAALGFLLIEEFQAWKDGADSILGPVFQFMLDVWDAIGAAAAGMWRGINDGMVSFFDVLATVWDVIPTVGEFAEWASNVATGVLDHLLAIPKQFLDSFGGALGRAALAFGIGDAGSSASASPAAQGAGSVGGASTVNQTVNMPINAAAGQSEQSIGAAAARGVQSNFDGVLRQAGRAAAQ